MQETDDKLIFKPLPPPTDEDIVRLTSRLAVRLGAIAKRRMEHAQIESPPDDEQAFVHESAAASLRVPPAEPRTAASQWATDKLDPSDCPESPIRPRHLSWAKLLRRVLDIDALTCPRCSTSMVVIAFLTNPPVLRLILDHLKLPSSPPQIAPARILTAEMDMVGNELSHDIEEHSHWQSGFSSLSRAPP